MKAFQFAYIRHRIHPKVEQEHTGWYLLIETSSELANFLAVRGPMLAANYADLKQRVSAHDHFKDLEQHAMALTLLGTDDKKELSRKTCVDDVMLLHDRFLNPYRDIFENGKHPLMVNKNMGFRTLDETCRILERRFADKIEFPHYDEQDIRITRWPGGIHYYAKIGALEVQDAEYKTKWNTAEEARRQAKLYLEKHLQKNLGQVPA